MILAVVVLATIVAEAVAVPVAVVVVVVVGMAVAVVGAGGGHFHHDDNNYLTSATTTVGAATAAAHNLHLWSGVWRSRFPPMVSQGMRGILVAGVVCGTGPCDDGSAMVARMEGPASGILVTVVAFGVRLHKTCKRHRDAVAGKPGERRICDRCRFGALILTCSRGGMEATNTHTHGKKGF